jgi:signal peptide peptidase SppA
MKSLNKIIEKVYNEKWLILPSTHMSMIKQLDAVISGKRKIEIPTPDMPELPYDEVKCPPDDEKKLNVITICVDGVIGKHMSLLETECGGCDLDSIAAQLDIARDDVNVDTIILMFNTPGGTVNGVEEVGQLISDISKTKRVIAYTDTMCCSAGYWLMSQCGEVYCSPSSTIGSVGVYSLVLDETRAMDMAGLSINVFKNGKYKLTGAPFLKLTDEEKILFQSDVDKTALQFKNAVNSKRTIDAQYLEGGVFDGNEAVEYGFCDGLLNFPSELDKFLQMN